MNELISIVTGAIMAITGFVGGVFDYAPAPYRYDGNGPYKSLQFGATNFPTSLDSLTNPGATDSVATVSHSGQHSNANDAIEAVEAKLGITASTPVSGSVLVGDGTGTSRWSTFATTTSLYTTNFLATGSSTLQAFTFTNATGTSATTTNFFATNASSTNHSFVTGTGNSITLNGDLTATNGTGRFNNVWANASSTLQNFTFVNATGTSATTTNFFATNASTTNLRVTTGNISNLTVSSCTGCGSQTNALTIIPKPQLLSVATSSTLMNMATTIMSVGQVVIPQPITVNKITVYGGDDFTSNFTLDLTLYSEDGQTQLFSVTTDTFTGASQVKTTAVSSVAVSAGTYYMAINSSSAANNGINSWNTLPFRSLNTLSSEPTLEGTVTITADTPPATIDPSTLGAPSTINRTVVFRLDN